MKFRFSFLFRMTLCCSRKMNLRIKHVATSRQHERSYSTTCKCCIPYRKITAAIAVMLGSKSLSEILQPQSNKADLTKLKGLFGHTAPEGGG